jgi:hypothetical protein
MRDQYHPCSVAADTRRHQTSEEARGEMFESAAAALHTDFCCAFRQGGTVSTPGCTTRKTPINVLLRDALYERNGEETLDEIRKLIARAEAGHAPTLLAMEASRFIGSLAQAHAEFHVSDAVAEAAGEGVL